MTKSELEIISMLVPESPVIDAPLSPAGVYDLRAEQKEALRSLWPFKAVECPRNFEVARLESRNVIVAADYPLTGRTFIDMALELSREKH